MTAINTMNRIPRMPESDRQGTVAVEFAIVLPVILITFFGLLSLSRTVILRDVAEHAAYEGARKGVVVNSTAEECRAKALEFLDHFGVQDAVVTVEPAVLAFSTTHITVTVDVPFSSNSWGGHGFVPFDWNLSRTITLSRDFESLP